MTDSDSDADVTVVDAVDAYLQRKAVGDPDGPGAGTYASNAESILRRWADWLEGEHGLRSLFVLEVEHMRSYADELRARADRGEYAASTAGTYYAVVRAFLSWCVRGGILETNPAATDAAESALPTAEERPDSEFWTADQRRRLENHVRERALEAAADGVDRDERRNRLREYAMVAVLAHSGVRGSELFRVPDDERRTGATWNDVDFYTGTIRVLGKSQRLEDVPLPAPARTPLRRYRVVLDPPSNDWPLFPTRHAPSIARRVREVLAERGHDEDRIESLLDERTATQLARERAIAPPAITTEGARSVLKRLCEAADVDVDGDYLTPRGVRGTGTGDGEDAGYRREATDAKPALRASVLEQAIAVPEEQPVVIDVDPIDSSEGDERSENN
ncbi:site-specific integrase (plasmid) [Haloterrigena salifodinae]|uniref:Site-specific integrase n=1 Tax=Haloterrigena salifodinae TaxID=2675099 RepID=A0A8T8E7C7_9EURY|nr:site-specific integrase [Haloterrigena salifodinae]QRV17513.1 site-specific integrase [Haloterrigena salifodinae]